MNEKQSLENDLRLFQDMLRNEKRAMDILEDLIEEIHTKIDRIQDRLIEINLNEG